MHIDFLVEEWSAKELLNNILPSILKPENTFEIRAFQGKMDLLKKLPGRLQGYKSWMPEDYKIVILIDRDEEDCQELKNKLERIAKDTGLVTKSVAKSNQPFQILTRLAIEELEAWLFGDVPALNQAYPRVSINLASKEKYRDPDAITGGTWEALEKVLQKAGYHQGGLEKVKAAREISKYMNPEENRSRSFQIFYNGLLELQNLVS